MEKCAGQGKGWGGADTHAGRKKSHKGGTSINLTLPLLVSATHNTMEAPNFFLLWKLTYKKCVQLHMDARRLSSKYI